MSRTLTGSAYHVMFDRSAWCMISKGDHVNVAGFVLLAGSEEAETWLPSFWVQGIIKQLLLSVFVTSRIIKVSVKVISLSLRLLPITTTSTSIILDKPHPVIVYRYRYADRSYRIFEQSDYWSMKTMCTNSRQKQSSILVTRSEHGVTTVTLLLWARQKKKRIIETVMEWSEWFLQEWVDVYRNLVSQQLE